MSEPVVVGVDFAHHAFDVVAVATRLAEDLETSLVLAHVLELAPGMKPETLIQPAWAEAPLPAREALEIDARKHLAPLVELCEMEGVEAVTCLLLGPRVPTLAACAAERGARFLVVGTHTGSGLLARFGSRTEKLADAAHCPLVVVKPGGDLGPGDSTVQSQVLSEEDG